MIPRDLNPTVRLAVRKLFPDCAAQIEDKLLRASAMERSHRDILAFAFGDKERLERLCIACEDDDRNVWIMEDFPEDHLRLEHIKRRDDATAEVARRFEFLGFAIPERFAGWGHTSKSWKPEWSNQGDHW
jgi:hypothetical protein